MIVMPVWVILENDSEYTVLFGSEPKADAKKEILPKDCVENIIYAPMIHESGNKFALVTLHKNKIPDNLRHFFPSEKNDN